MLEEALAAPGCVAQQLALDADAYAALARRLRAAPGHGLLTLARGSSDHAAHHLAYLVMARLGRLVTSLPMSLVTLHKGRIAAPNLVSFAFSQSGQSPDLIEPTRAFRAAGACTVALVNAEGSPLAAAAEHVLPLHAGPEQSVAATKSYIAQLVAGARLVAAWEADATFGAALQQLPQALEQAAALRWQAAVEQLQNAEQLFVIGRGHGQAEAFSGAEVQHGPMALVGEGWPLLVLAPRGPAQAGLVELAQRLHARGARVLLAVPAATPGTEGLTTLPLATTAHEDLDAIAAVQSFYPMVEALARARGRDPDRPPFLAKVTQTH